MAIYFYISGASWEDIALITWGMLVIGLIDNLLRPILGSRGTRMPDYVVAITTLAAMAVFGINRFVIGPVIAALFTAVWRQRGAARVDTSAGVQIDCICHPRERNRSLSHCGRSDTKLLQDHFPFGPVTCQFVAPDCCECNCGVQCVRFLTNHRRWVEER